MKHILIVKMIYIMSNEAALHRIFQNILKNCIEHGKIYFAVHLFVNTDSVRIDFENDCRDYEHTDIDRVFDRFYKADIARSKTSTGLGL